MKQYAGCVVRETVLCSITACTRNPSDRSVRGSAMTMACIGADPRSLAFDVRCDARWVGTGCGSIGARPDGPLCGGGQTALAHAQHRAGTMPLMHDTLTRGRHPR